MALTHEQRRLVLQVLLFAASQVLMYHGVKWIIDQMDPNKDRKKAAAAMSKQVLARLKCAGSVQLSEYESMIAANIIDASEMNVGWKDIGGLDTTIEALKEAVVLPFSRPDIFQGTSKLLGPPKGILLFGPPGCGKTMLAKAIAKESGCCFINLQLSTIMDKWFGESQKLIDALFTLARKLEPCVIFIDEIDSFLRTRASTDNESMALVKAQFMQLWDGFETGNARVIVIGATNRPDDVDAAILRRLPRTCYVGLPDVDQRRRILQVVLTGEQLASDVSVGKLAEMTDGYSGNDLAEFCRNAKLVSVRDFVKQEAARPAPPPSATPSPAAPAQLRPMKLSDFASAKSAVETAISN